MNTTKTLTNLALAAIIFTACQKDITSKKSVNSVPATSEVSADVDEVSREYDASTVTNRLILRPGPKTGQDAWIEYLASNESNANSNTGSATQFKVLAWTINGAPVYTRSLIRFDSLSIVPADKKIVSAILYLYGLSNSPEYLPQGNSTYPGSPYNSFGPNTVQIQKVKSAWNENTVTWNTQPTTTDVNQTTIPESTSQWNYDVSVNVTNLVKTMLVNYGGKNYGFMLRFADESVYKSMGFYTSEASEWSKRPKLVVTYR